MQSRCSRAGIENAKIQNIVAKTTRAQEITELGAIIKLRIINALHRVGTLGIIFILLRGLKTGVTSGIYLSPINCILYPAKGQCQVSGEFYKMRLIDRQTNAGRKHFPLAYQGQVDLYFDFSW
jgi:hypothetical protein